MKILANINLIYSISENTLLFITGSSRPEIHKHTYESDSNEYKISYIIHPFLFKYDIQGTKINRNTSQLVISGYDDGSNVTILFNYNTMKILEKVNYDKYRLPLVFVNGKMIFWIIPKSYGLLTLEIWNDNLTNIEAEIHIDSMNYRYIGLTPDYEIVYANLHNIQALNVLRKERRILLRNINEIKSAVILNDGQIVIDNSKNIQIYE